MLPAASLGLGWKRIAYRPSPLPHARLSIVTSVATSLRKQSTYHIPPVNVRLITGRLIYLCRSFEFNVLLSMPLAYLNMRSEMPDFVALSASAPPRR